MIAGFQNIFLGFLEPVIVLEAMWKLPVFRKYFLGFLVQTGNLQILVELCYDNRFFEHIIRFLRSNGIVKAGWESLWRLPILRIIF